MMRRFNLYFSLFDDSRYAEAKLDSSNPFETEQLVICSLDFVRRNKQRLEELADAQWDLLVVDEAHHLAWSEEAPSREYQVIEQLAEHIPGVLLLTATPEQLGQQSTLRACACSTRTVSTTTASSSPSSRNTVRWPTPSPCC